MPRCRPKLHLPDADWPAVDRVLWQRAFRADDPFDHGAGTRLARTTKQRYLVGWRRFLGYLALEDREALEIAPAGRITVAHVRGFVAHLRQTNGAHSVAIQLEAMYHAARVMMPEQDWAWLKSIKTRLYAAVPPYSAKGPAITSTMLVDLGLVLMEESQPVEGQELNMADAVRYRDGLIIAMLGFIPLRCRNIASLEIGRTFVREGDGWAVVIPTNETKSGKEPIEFAIAPLLSPYFDRYLEFVRPRVLRRATCTALWVSPKGGALGYSSFGPMLARHTMRRWGIRIAPHDVRDAGATQWAIAAPDQIGVARDLLGHADLRPTTKHYNRARGIEASRALAQEVARLKKTGVSGITRRV
jgi:integrase/recombinase XerD